MEKIYLNSNVESITLSEKSIDILLDLKLPSSEYSLLLFMSKFINNKYNEVCFLDGKPINTQYISKNLDINEKAIIRSLGNLINKGILYKTKNGNNIKYTINPFIITKNNIDIKTIELFKNTKFYNEKFYNSKEYYVYRFLDKDNDVIYVGKTTNMKQRLSVHFGTKGHLDDKCYDETNKIDYTINYSDSENSICEIFFINYYKPKYNKEFNEQVDIKNLIDINNIQWIEYKNNLFKQ